MIYWLGSFRGDLVVKRRPVRCRLMPGPCGSGRPQSRAGRNRGGRWGQPPISQPGGGGCAAVALVTARREGGCTGDGAAWEGPLVPARPQPRGPPLLTLAAVGSFCALLPGLTPVRKEGTDIPAPGLVRLPREPGRAPASSPGGSGGPSPAPPASCARAAPPRSYAEHPGRLHPALCGAGARLEPSDRRGLSSPQP